MNKSELVDFVAEKSGVAKTQVAKILDAVAEGVAQGLKKDGEVRWAGFGNFAVKERPARKGRNPRTGQEITIAASKQAKFTAAKALKDVVDGGQNKQNASKGGKK